MILDALFGDPDVDALLSDAALVAAMLHVEVALATRRGVRSASFPSAPSMPSSRAR